MRTGRLVSLCLGLALLFGAGKASAQVHWDVSAQAGVMKRFLAGAPEDAGFGPTAQLTGHVALLPLVHFGGYFGHDISPLPGPASARNVTFGGLRVKGMLPFVRGTMRAWIFGGFGYAGVYQPSFARTFRVADGSGGTVDRSGRVEGAGGSFFDVPFGIGASYKLFPPWVLVVELGGRVGVGHRGSVYEAPGPQLTLPGGDGNAAAASGLPANAVPAGLDRLGVGLTVGVLVDL